MRAIDVAAGTGAFACAIARRVDRVTCADLSAKMIQIGRRCAQALNLDNVDFINAAAESLPFEDAAFDLAVTRFALHHVLDPQAVLSEMSRVVRNGGDVVVVDMLSDDDRDIAARQNVLERFVDGTHTRMLTKAEMLLAMRSAGLAPKNDLTRDVRVDFELWQSHLAPAEPQKQRVKAALDSEIRGGPVTGFRPHIHDGRIHFYHTWGAIVAQKEGIR